jgi:transposase
MSISRKSYASDVSDDEWALVAPWRFMPNDLPRWEIVYQQARRWLSAGCFEALAEDLRVILRLAAGRAAQPTAAVVERAVAVQLSIPAPKFLG